MPAYAEKLAPRPPARQTDRPPRPAFRRLLTGRARRSGADGLTLAVTAHSRSFVPQSEAGASWLRLLARLILGSAAALIVIGAVIEIRFWAFG